MHYLDVSMFGLHAKTAEKIGFFIKKKSEVQRATATTKTQVLPGNERNHIYNICV